MLHCSGSAGHVSVLSVSSHCRYVGDIFLIGSEDIIKPNLSVREGLEIVVSVGMALPAELKVH